MWVHAPAGYGKTAVAGTISKMLEETEGLDFSPLGATFHFWRTSPERNSPARFIITIAYQLAMSIPELAPYIEIAVKRNPMILRKALETQVMKLIVEPFKALDELEDMPNRLIIVDGLDECINSVHESRTEKQYAEDQEIAQLRILDLIKTLQSHRLPLSFLILSRPEVWIKQHFQSSSFGSVVEVLDLYALGDHARDTEVYIRAELSRISSRIKGDRTPGPDDDDWPGEEVIRSFVRWTNGHMPFASTVIQHIDNRYDDPRELFENILHIDVNPLSTDRHTSPFSSLNELYMQIMRSCPEGNRALMIEVLEDLSACAHYFCSRVGFARALAVLDRLAGRAPGQGVRALRPLHAVLPLSHGVAANERSPNLSPFIHPSFSNFLLNSNLSLEFAINRRRSIPRLLNGCLNCMSNRLPKNKPDEDHYRFAVRMWPQLFQELELQLEPYHAEYYDFLTRLLSIDLPKCLLQAHTDQGSTDDIIYSDFPPKSAYRSGHANIIVPRSSLRIYRRDPLVEKAVAHVVSTFEASLASFLERSPDDWPKKLDHAVVGFLEGRDGLDEQNQVVRVWKGLKPEHQERMITLVKTHGASCEALLRDTLSSTITDGNTTAM
ncbi:hypothetical protein MD484_g1650, partial [Candolleomyces efflorescens]